MKHKLVLTLITLLFALAACAGTSEPPAVNAASLLGTPTKTSHTIHPTPPVRLPK